MSDLISIILIATTIWVYLDVTKHNVGRVPNAKISFNWPAWEWVAALAFLWIVFFPLYLYRRDDLIEIGKENPVIYKRRAFYAFLIGMVGLVLISFLNSPVGH